MTRNQKIQFLKSRGITIPDNCADAWLTDQISKFQNRVVNFKGGRINVIFDKADESPVDVMIYEDIGDDPWMGSGFTAKDFSDAVKDIPKTRPLNMRINSAGGSVWEGMAIKTLFDEWKGRKTVSIDGMAASVASWIGMSADEISAPKHAQMFIHDAWGMCMGNAADMRAQADDLDKTSEQIAGIYSRKTGKTVDECRSLMKENSLFTAEEANALGFIDKITEGEAVQNFTPVQIKNMTAKLAMLNSKKSPAQQGETTKNTMNRKDKIALLNKWGISTSKNATDKWLDQMINAAKAFPENAAKFKNGKDGDHADDCSCEDCAGSKNAPEPSEEKPDADAGGGAPGKDGKLFTAATDNDTNSAATAKMNKQLKNFFDRQRRQGLQSQFDKLVTDGKIGANDVKDWMETALASEDSDDGANPIVSKLNKLPGILPGIAPLNIQIGESDSLTDLDKNVQSLMKAQGYFNRNGTKLERLRDRMEIAENSKKVSFIINRLKKYSTTDYVPFNGAGRLPQLVGPLREAWDSWASGMGPRNANTMSTTLLRQVIMSEVMRAFRRQFASLEIFSHNFGNIPLEGTDYMEVPYYPLDTVASSEFVYANGYVINPNAQTLSKQVYVGGIGNGVASSGSGRKYKALQFTAYEIRRQPWLDIQKLSIMAGEQLAIDVRGDIMGTWINAANFGNAIWTGGAGGFDHTVVGNVLMQAANKAYWPVAGRHLVLTTAHYSNLAIDPGITPWLNIGTTDILREGKIGGLYKFESILEDATYPIANYIRGGDGTLTNGTDPYSAGFTAWPSAILVATAPIMPPPGVLKKLISYEQITDDQTGLAFTYQFWGDESRNRDNEIIECSYGSGLGELAALQRLTTQGN